MGVDTKMTAMGVDASLMVKPFLFTSPLHCRKLCSNLKMTRTLVLCKYYIPPFLTPLALISSQNQISQEKAQSQMQGIATARSKRRKQRSVMKPQMRWMCSISANGSSRSGTMEVYFTAAFQWQWAYRPSSLGCVLPCQSALSFRLSSLSYSVAAVLLNQEGSRTLCRLQWLTRLGWAGWCSLSILFFCPFP